MSTAIVKFLIKNYSPANLSVHMDAYVDTFGEEFREIADDDDIPMMLRHLQKMVLGTNRSHQRLESRTVQELQCSEDKNAVLDSYLQDCEDSNRTKGPTLYRSYRAMMENYAAMLLHICDDSYPLRYHETGTCHSNIIHHPKMDKYKKFREILRLLQEEQLSSYNNSIDRMLYDTACKPHQLTIPAGGDTLKSIFAGRLNNLGPCASFLKKLEAYLEMLA